MLAKQTNYKGKISSKYSGTYFRRITFWKKRLAIREIVLDLSSEF